jgi:hypothetical protein
VAFERWRLTHLGLGTWVDRHTHLAATAIAHRRTAAAYLAEMAIDRHRRAAAYPAGTVKRLVETDTVVGRRTRPGLVRRGDGDGDDDGRCWGLDRRRHLERYCGSLTWFDACQESHLAHRRQGHRRTVGRERRGGGWWRPRGGEERWLRWKQGRRSAC